jgi:hypothetical protein
VFHSFPRSLLRLSLPLVAVGTTLAMATAAQAATPVVGHVGSGVHVIIQICGGSPSLRANPAHC